MSDPDSPPYCRFLSRVVDIAREAGDRILEIYETDFDARRKEDGSPLTAADCAAHRTIVDALRAMDPGTPVLSEESKSVDYAQRSSWRQFWLVDPLDGTREFIKRNGEFTVNIALIDGDQPVLGVVHVPVSGVTYLACRGDGAYCRRGEGAAERIRAGRYHGGRARVVGSRSHAGTHLAGFLERLRTREGEFEMIGMGSSLKLCLVAEGRADVYPRLGPTSEWDTAAAQCVVEVAGGRVIDLRGDTLRYNKESVLNPWFIVTDAGGYDWAALVEHDQGA
jgi:3'(2'), 5'-bisphosphate nucleotidase